ncbi:hypothetical protein RJ639_021168 [Escallonia herrerae]|uniref:Integrase zinc-binding domain-containing protein n=1 Tax=Escallonia herrerae TaxID=1293975 RepID=A0AA88V2Z7_9ASTE|nr:hypothetical protein RJ639_021168 [Escallonia herrerae]
MKIHRRSLAAFLALILFGTLICSSSLYFEYHEDKTSTATAAFLGDRYASRTLLSSVASLHQHKPSVAREEPKKAVEQTLRKKPASGPNPIQNKGENGRADALASLAASLGLSENKEMTITEGAQRILQPYEKVTVDVQMEEVLTMSKRLDGQDDPLDWRLPFMEYLQDGRLPDDRAKQAEVRRRSVQFVMWKDTLYKRSLDGMLLRCIAKDKVEEVMGEVHSRACGAHQSGPKLQMLIKRLGYYWPTMIADCIGFAKRCQACQFHGDFFHSPPEPLHFTVCSWLFAAWGMDIIGPFTPPSSKGHRYILAATDYFSKWAEAIALRDVKRDIVADFIRTHII